MTKIIKLKEAMERLQEVTKASERFTPPVVEAIQDTFNSVEYGMGGRVTVRIGHRGDMSPVDSADEAKELIINILNDKKVDLQHPANVTVIEYAGPGREVIRKFTLKGSPVREI